MTEKMAETPIQIEDDKVILSKKQFDRLAALAEIGSRIADAVGDDGRGDPARDASQPARGEPEPARGELEPARDEPSVLNVRISPLETMTDRQIIREYRKHFDSLKVDVGRIGISTDEDGTRILHATVAPEDQDEFWPQLPSISMRVARLEHDVREQVDRSYDDACHTVVVNMFGGPGAGKTTAAYEICSKLKAMGYSVGYAPEIAKELAITIGNTNLPREERVEAAIALNGTWESQTRLYANQKARLDKLVGQCDFVVTDSPAILGCVYLNEGETYRRAEFEKRCLGDFAGYDNFNVFVVRGESYSEHGRVHDLEQAVEIDSKLRKFMKENGLYYLEFDQDQITRAVGSIVEARERSMEREPGGRPEPEKVIAEPVARAVVVETPVVGRKLGR